MDILTAVLARDEVPVSASTQLRVATEPATQLGPATARYLDALALAAQDHVGPDGIARIERTAETLAPGLTEEPAWPTLRAHLALLTAADPGSDPADLLTQAVQHRELGTALDRAAVLDHRLDPRHRIGPGPLPWLPAVPPALTDHPTWGPYLTARAGLVRDVADRAAAAARHGAPPAWARHLPRRPGPDLLADLALWRAAHQIPDTDQRPTGPRQLPHAAASWQRHLHARLGTHQATAEWGPRLRDLALTGADLGGLADRLAALARAGLPAGALLARAAAEGPLPDEQAAAALWWRIAAHLGPATDTQTADPALSTDWTQNADRASRSPRPRPAGLDLVAGPGPRPGRRPGPRLEPARPDGSGRRPATPGHPTSTPRRPSRGGSPS